MLGLVRNVKRRVVQHFRQRRLQQFTKLIDEGVPLDRTWKLCEEILAQMDVRDYQGLPIVLLQRHLVRTPYRSIQTYQKTLDSIKDALKQEQKLDRGWSSFETQTLTVADFMMTEDGYYMTSDALPKFLVTAKELFEFMDQADGEDLGVVGFNNRALIPLFVRLRDTLMDLYDLQFAL